MADEKLNIVVLGASFAGLSVVHHLIRQVIPAITSKSKTLAYRVIVISPSSHLYWNISAPRAAVSNDLVTHDESFIPIQNAFQQYSSQVLTWLLGVATDLDPTTRTITITTIGGGDGKNSKKRSIGHHLSKSSFEKDIHDGVPFGWHESVADDARNAEIRLNYHALIFATGSTSHSSLMSLRGPHVNTRDALDAFRSRLISAKTIVVAGGGPSGVELAGQIAYYSNKKDGPLRIPDNQGLGNKRRESDGSMVETGPFIPLPQWSGKKFRPRQIVLVSSSARLLPKLDKTLGEKAARQLKNLGVHVRIGITVRQASADSTTGLTTVQLDSGELISCDLYAPCTGVAPNTQYLPPASPLLEDGYIKTTAMPTTLRVEVPDHLLPMKGEATLTTSNVPGSRFSSSTTGSSNLSGDIDPRLYAIGDCASYSTGCVGDIYASMPVLVRNMKNDLLAYQLHANNPYGGNAEDIAELRRRDAVFTRDRRISQLVPIGGRRPGGVGILLGHHLPSLLVWLFKGRSYMAKHAIDVVEEGISPYQMDNKKAFAP
ncbi:hypothetical protein FH972_024462 [Carpinus fangiana]|uniref:FAD/NAD(P)-binding domain-containing protein n=1 Tax=Carpinus fangiana TaxID=176857 RepID=A0A5N6KYI5_9ROSI|nr:hypothetical protein FH972_024462 [Carpinus fangiana]